MTALIILGGVLVLIAVRQIGRVRLQIWQAMLLGALAVLVTGAISPGDAVRAINPDVMLFLFGVFVIGRALEESGALARLSGRLFARAGTADALVLGVIFGAGLLSAFLMNDTLAIIGTPVMLALARRADLPPALLLLALAFAVTIGSVTSPIGNPQNLLIASGGGLPNPFVTFFHYLFVPTLLNLLLAYGVLRLAYRRAFHGRPLPPDGPVATDPGLARLTQVSLGVLVAMVAAKIVAVFAGWAVDFRLTYIALAGAAPVLLLSRKRFGIVRRIDWPTLVFFAAMFVLMAAVWRSPLVQDGLAAAQAHLGSNGAIMGVSVALSQLISNVPLVALYLPVVSGTGATASLLALAAGSTIAGNLTILGAASNVIIIQNAERRGARLTFRDFVRLGAPLTALNIGVYWLFLKWFGA
jgi:Na+/H+ antiporter NhaD/arsenite permease-like protein